MLRSSAFSGGENVYANCVAIIAPTIVLIYTGCDYLHAVRWEWWVGFGHPPPFSQLTLTTADDMRQEVPIKGTQAACCSINS